MLTEEESLIRSEAAFKKTLQMSASDLLPSSRLVKVGSSLYLRLEVETVAVEQIWHI